MNWWLRCIVNRISLECWTKRWLHAACTTYGPCKCVDCSSDEFFASHSNIDLSLTLGGTRTHLLSCRPSKPPTSVRNVGYDATGRSLHLLVISARLSYRNGQISAGLKGLITNWNYTFIPPTIDEPMVGWEGIGGGYESPSRYLLSQLAELQSL